MNNALLNRATLSHAPHRLVVGGQDSVREALEKFSEIEEDHSSDPCSSPHYVTIIQPFLQRLEEVKLRAVGERPPQTGDAELAEIAKIA